MHRNTYYFAFTLLAFSLFYSSCNKTDDDPINQDTAFSTGNTENMIVSEQQLRVEITGPYGGYNYAMLDVDQDGTNDFRLDDYYSTEYGSKSSSLTPINDDFDVVVAETQDSIFQCYWTDGNNESTTYFNQEAGYSCNGAVTFHYNFDVIKCRGFASGTGIDASMEWSHAATMLAALNTSGSSVPDASGQYMIYSGNNIRRVGWSDQGRKYVIFRKKEGSSYRYGWIDLAVSNYYTMTVYSYAIQPAS